MTATATAFPLRANQALDDALALLELTSTERLVAQILVRHRNRETGQCNPSVERLAEKIVRTGRTAQRALGRLMEVGFIAPDDARGGRRGGRDEQGRGRSTWWLFPQAQEMLEAGAAWREERRAARREATPADVPPTPASPPAEESVEETAPAASEPLPHPELRTVWGRAWLARYGEEYTWPSGLQVRSKRAHRRAVQESAAAAPTLEAFAAAVDVYLTQEAQPSAQPQVGPYGAWPHADAPSLPKFRLRLDEWLRRAGTRGRAGPPPPTAQASPTWARLSAAERAQVLERYGTQTLTDQLAAELEVPGVLESLLA